ncbi:proteasome activator pa28 REG alpha beta subunit [Coniophora puteana RWD-64-598 SS2]|uniref:Proteasome activator pa28 REG alpha beta subunit n=1 Tax=Coniophora puteana (strain RWD-64-598) TaxID=741705 RepID=A0A5M3N669_CONPW|nr:proteasome activator pa28 REG alpha beta subunit [Coniophora puteana RWD-64-598 SS2]EIW86913.1 proteasome activator pa28 REG alpha beta subunit [Coniophora puteana RWD-64-598 SS2]
MAKEMDRDISRKLESFRGSVATAAEDIIFRIFPSKIMYGALRDYTSLHSPDSPFHISHASTSTDATVHPAPTRTDGAEVKKRKRSESDDGSSTTLNDIVNARYPSVVHANRHITGLRQYLKDECEQLADSCDKVKLWINITMPKIEDGDNFGVQIQEEVLTELMRSQESAYNIRDAVRQDHLARAKICSKLIKYPNVEDYALGLREHDEKQLFFARQNIKDLRNVYAVMADILHKNIAKIRAPKGNNGASLY